MRQKKLGPTEELNGHSFSAVTIRRFILSIVLMHGCAATADSHATAMKREVQRG